ncbi:foldase protein PrsA 3 precursor [bacterium BMS3Abin05]|nr:foldase protein PrsA 3 precursor [bacterium BMS3Abin05]
MRKGIILILGLLLVAAACSKKKETALYSPNSNQYKFFEIVSKKVPILNPNQSNVLIRTTKFKITTRDVMPGIYREFGIYGENPQNLSEKQLTAFLHHLASQKANQKLFAIAAQNNHISFPQDSIEAELQEMYTIFGGKKAFVKDLASQGLTVDAYTSNLKTKVLYRKYLNQVLFKNISVSEAEIKDYYNSGKSATIRQISLSFKGKSEAEKKKIYQKMEMILKKARSGEDFAKLAGTYSDDQTTKNEGGLVQDFPRSRMPEPIEKAVFRLPAGRISDIIETGSDYLILKVIQRQKETKPYQEAKKEIKKYLEYREKVAAYSAGLDSLKKTFHYQKVY